MSSPLPTVVICCAYYYLVRIVGPRFMANRKPFKLRRILMAYNVYQILVNSWLFYEFASIGWLTGRYNYTCQPVDYSDTDKTAQRALRASYWFFISKFVDFFDTFFFVLRKKERQISTLHLYHHGMVPILLWPAVRFVSGGHATFFGFTNALEHVVMYAYYLVASTGHTGVFRWKKYLTIFQMILFGAACLHSLQLLVKNDCQFPAPFTLWIAGHTFGFLCMYIHFYRKSYTRKTRSSSSKTVTNSHGKRE